MSPERGPLDNGRLRARVRAGEATLGTFIGTASPVTAEICAAAGFDWLLLDLEHGAGGEEQVRATVPVAAAYGVPTVVRVESDARIRVGRVLDAGAAGVMLPRLVLTRASDPCRPCRPPRRSHQQLHCGKDRLQPRGPAPIGDRRRTAAPYCCVRALSR